MRRVFHAGDEGAIGTLALMNYDEVIQRLATVVGKSVWVLVWADGDPCSVVASLSGVLEWGGSEAAGAAWRAYRADALSRSHLPKDVAEKVLSRGDELFDALRQRRETGEWPPDIGQPGIIAVAEKDPGAGRREHFMLATGGQRAAEIYLDEDDFQGAGYDRDGLTVRLAGATLTFMNVYRRKPRDHQRKKR
jgi:hypothetical protein